MIFSQVLSAHVTVRSMTVPGHTAIFSLIFRLQPTYVQNPSTGWGIFGSREVAGDSRALVLIVSKQ
jgi:hypothetical protein